MQKKYTILCLLLIGVLIQSNLFAVEKNVYSLKSQALVNNLRNGKYVEATSNFDETMKASMTAEQLKQIWTNLSLQLGSLEEVAPTKQKEKNGVVETITVLTFEKFVLDAKIYFRDDKKISGFFLTPHKPDVEYQLPTYADKKNFEELDLTVDAGDTPLKGKICIPKGNYKFPVVILVHGSGPNDMDETIGGAKVFKDISYGLASRGIAVIRYNKRSNTYKKPEKNPTYDTEVVDDVMAAIELAKTYPTIDTNSIFVLGHSLGGMMIPRIADKNASVAGFISMAGSLRSFGEILLPQLSYLFSLDNEMSAEEQKELDKAEKLIKYTFSDKLNENSPVDSLLFQAPASYWLDYRKYDMIALAQDIERPFLIMQGERDYQITKEDFNYWKMNLAGKENVEYKLYPKLNHLFIAGEGLPNPGEYEKVANVEQKVIIDIIAFINMNK
jgi:dienelactone hydrolase